MDEAEQEIVHFSEICYNDFLYMRQAIAENSADKFSELREKLIKYEAITDRIEYEIADYLYQVAKGEISESSAKRINGMYKIIGELESIGRLRRCCWDVFLRVEMSTACLSMKSS